MAFTAPDEELTKPPETGGFSAPQADLPPAPPTAGFSAPKDDVNARIHELAQQDHSAIFQHAAQNPEDFETAYQADKLRRGRPFLEKAGEFASSIPMGIVHGVQGLGRFAAGTVEAPLHALEWWKPEQTKLAENVLAAQHGEQAIANAANVVTAARPGAYNGGWGENTGEIDTRTPEDMAREGDNRQRALFSQRVQQAKNEMQLAKGIPLDSGAISDIYQGGQIVRNLVTGENNEVEPPSAGVGPEALAATGAPQANQGTVTRMSAASDPTMLALAAAPGLPGAAQIGGAATELAGKTLQLPGKAISAIKSPFTKAADLAHAAVNPMGAVAMAAKKTGARGLQALGDIIEQQGREMRTGTPSPLTTAAATAEATGQSAIGTNLKRAIGDTAAKGAATAVGMAPINAILSEGDPNALGESTAGAAVFGGAIGAFQRARPMMVEAVRPFLRSEGARALAEAGEGNDPLAAKSAAYVMSLPPEARDSTLEAIGVLQGLPATQGANPQRAKLYVLNADDYQQAIADNFGKEQAASGGGRGFFLNNEGTAFINGEYHSGLAPSEMTHTIGHEFGGHAGINIMRAMGAKGGMLHQGLMDAARQALFVRQPDAQHPYGTPSPDFKRFVDAYNLAFDKTGQTQRLDWRDPEAIEEFLSEQAGQQFAAKGAGELALPKSVQDRINDGIGRYLGQIIGVDTRKIGTDTHFSRQEIGELSQTVEDTLRQVVGMKLREGAEIPEPAKNTTTRIAELNQVLSKPRPAPGAPLEDMRAWIAEQTAARRELTSLQGQAAPNPAAGPAPRAPAPPVVTSPPEVTADALKALSVMGIKGARANALIRMANAQHGSPINNSGQLAAGAFRIHGGGDVKPGEFVPKPQAPAEPVPVPQDATFRDELGATHKVTGPAQGAPRIGDIVATREGEIRRITRIFGDTVDTARPIDPLNARGTKTHKLADIQPLAHDYAPETTAPGAPPAAPAKPVLTVQPKGDRFIIVDAAGNPVSNNTFATEAAAQQSIRQQGKGKFSIFPNHPGAPPDVIDTIQDRVPGIYFGGMSKEEAESFIQDKYLRDRLATSNPAYGPDEVLRNIQPTAEEPIDHRVSSIAELGAQIEEAYRQRKSLAEQQASADKAAKVAQKNAPNEPAEPEPPTNAEGQDNLPPEPARAVAVSEGPTPTEEPAPLSPADLDQIAAQAEQAVTAARAGTKKKAHTAAKEITDAQVDAVAAAHEQSVPANYQGVKLRRDALGKETISGTFNPSRPFDAFLLKLADLSPKAVDILQDLQGKIGQAVTVNYGHAPTSENGAKTASGRRSDQGASTAVARASGEAPTEDRDKTIIPTEFRFHKGSQESGPSVTFIGYSPEKLLSNFNHLAKALTEFGEPVPYRDIHDPHLVADMKGVARNHANGRKADGSAKIEGFPDVNVPAADDGYRPYPIPKDRADFINIILGDESAKSSEKGATPTQKLKQGLAAKNNVAMNAQGEVNGLRDALNAAKGPITGPDGKQTTWSKATLENPLSEALRVDLVNEVKPELNNADESIRKHGYSGDIGRFFAEGSPDRTFTAAGFLPDTGKIPNRQPMTPEENKRIFDSAKKIQGITRDVREAAYILPDGSMIDGSGRHQQPGTYAQNPDLTWRQTTPGKDWAAGQRVVDHREIEWEGQPSYQENWQPMVDFMERGAVRVDANAGLVSLHGREPLTASQEGALRRLIDYSARTNDFVYVDAEDSNGKKFYAEYPSPKPARVIGDIKRWSRGEERPSGAQFMPDTGAPKTAQEKAKERIAARDFAEKSKSGAFMPDATPSKEEPEPAGQSPSGSPRDRLSTGGTSENDNRIPVEFDIDEAKGQSLDDNSARWEDLNGSGAEIHSHKTAEGDYKYIPYLPGGKKLPTEWSLEDAADAINDALENEGGGVSSSRDTKEAQQRAAALKAHADDVREGVRNMNASRQESRRGNFLPDTSKPEEGETPGERLMREAEAAGLQPSLDTMKGVLRGDDDAFAKLRKMIGDKTGKPARFMPGERPSAKEAARARIAARITTAPDDKKRELAPSR